MNTTKFAMKLAIPLFVALAYGPAQGLAAPLLGSSESFSVLGASTVTNTGSTVIYGNLGLYDLTQTAGVSVTGFAVPVLPNMVFEGPRSTGLIAGPGVVNGSIHIDSPAAALAQADAVIAYNALATMTPNSVLSLTSYELGGQTLGAGVYKIGSSAAITGILTLDFTLNSNKAFVFQIGSTLDTAATNSMINVIGATAESGIYWQVGSSATLGTYTTFAGNIIALASDTVNTGATVCGRVWALTAKVALDTNTISNNCGLSNSYSSGLVLDSTGHAAMVPEPETYAMLLAGLGMMGFVARRRQRNLAAAA